MPKELTMKAMFGLQILFLIFNNSAQAADFSSLQIKGWKKEVLSFDHFRFSNPAEPETVIHLQVDSYDPENQWSQKTLQEDIRKMEKIRNDMSFFAAMKDYKISAAVFDGKVLDLEGSYVRMGNKQIRFKEINYYGKDHFLQVKLISETKVPSKETVKKILDELKPEKVEID